MPGRGLNRSVVGFIKSLIRVHLWNYQELDEPEEEESYQGMDMDDDSRMSSGSAKKKKDGSKSAKKKKQQQVYGSDDEDDD